MEKYLLKIFSLLELVKLVTMCLNKEFAGVPEVELPVEDEETRLIDTCDPVVEVDGPEDHDLK